MTERGDIIDRLFRAECESCGVICNIDADARCRECGTALRTAPQKVQDAIWRRNSFKSALSKREHLCRILLSREFPNNPTALSNTDHIQTILKPALAALDATGSAVFNTLDTTHWDPRQEDTRTAFTAAVRFIDDELAIIARLFDTTPPSECRALHRNITRMAMTHAHALLAAIAIVIARDATEAVESLTRCTAELEKAKGYQERISQMPTAEVYEEASRADGSMNLAVIARAGIGGEPKTIAETCALVREAFVDIPGMTEAADEYVLPFLPLVITTAAILDRDLIAIYAGQLRKVLDDADTRGRWIDDGSLLVQRLNRAADRLREHSERIARAVHHGLPRLDVLKLLTEVYLGQVEGALRDLGSIVWIASRFGNGHEDRHSYSIAVVDGIMAGEVVDVLKNLGPQCAAAISIIYRNAAAHAAVEITDTGVKATSTRIENGSVVGAPRQIDVTDSQFGEDVIALHEFMAALQLTLIPWLASHTETDIHTAFAAVVLTPRQRDQVLEMVGGTAGLLDVKVSGDENCLSVTARAVPEPDNAPIAEALVLAIATFGASNTIREVVLQLDEGAPVTFARSELNALNTDPLTGPALHGLFKAKWLLANQPCLSSHDQTASIILPLTAFVINVIALAFEEPVQAANMTRAATIVRRLLDRVEEVLAPKTRNSLADQSITQLYRLAVAFPVLASWYAGTCTPDEAHPAITQVASAAQANDRIRAEALTLRDGAEQPSPVE